MKRFLPPFVLLPMVVAAPAFADPAARSASARVDTASPARPRRPNSSTADVSNPRPPAPVRGTIRDLRESLRRPDFEMLETDVGRSPLGPKGAKL